MLTIFGEKQNNMKRLLIAITAALVLTFAVSINGKAQDNQYGIVGLYQNEDARNNQQTAGFGLYGIKNLETKGVKFTVLNDFYFYTDGVSLGKTGRVVQNDLRVRVPLQGLTWNFGDDQNQAQVYVTALTSVKNQDGRTQFLAAPGIGFSFNGNTFFDYSYQPAMGATQFQGHRFTTEHYTYLNSSQNYYNRVGVTGYVGAFNPNPNVKQDIGSAVIFVGFGKRY